MTETSDRVMETQNHRIRRSLLAFARGGPSASTPFDDDEPPKAPRVWANGAELIADQFGVQVA